MDFQNPIVEHFATGQEALLKATAATIDAARHANIPVIYVVVGFRPGFPEISDRNKLFSGIKAMGGLATDIHPQVAPKGNEPIVTKRRVGAFHGTDLEVILRAHETQTLVLCGISTSGVVLSTVRHAADSDYAVVVLSDCCSDPKANVHECLMNDIFPWQGTVATSADFIQAVKK
jgi:nicotinamidase-related amidase